MKALHKRMLVVLEGTENGKLSTYTSSGGIAILAGNMSTGFNSDDGLKDRWATVLSVGSEVTDVMENDRVLISQGKWSQAHEVDGIWFWMTDEEHVILIDNMFRETNGTEKTNAPVI